MIDHAELGGDAAHQRQVALGDRAVLEAIVELTRRLAVEGEQEHPAGGSVQAVHRKHESSQELPRPGDRDLVVVVPAAMHEQARRLVERGHARVAVQDRRRRIRRFHQGTSGGVCAARAS